MSGRDAAPDKKAPGLGAFVLNGLFFGLLLYATDLRFRTWVQYRVERAGAWGAWGSLEGWRRLRRWWKRTSPWYQELLEQERPVK